MELDKLLLKFVLKKTCKISQKNFGGEKAMRWD